MTLKEIFNKIEKFIKENPFSTIEISINQGKITDIKFTEKFKP